MVRGAGEKDYFTSICIFFTSANFWIVLALISDLTSSSSSPLLHSGLSSLLSGKNNLFLSPLTEWKKTPLTVLKFLKRIKSNYKAIYAVVIAEI